MSGLLHHRKIKFYLLLFTLFSIFAIADRAYAACTAPAKNEGIIIYNQDNHVMQYCDGTNWIPMGKAGSGASACHGTTTGTPDTPVERGNYTHATELNGTKGVAYANDLVYVTAETNDSLTIIDVCDPDTPTRRGYLQDSTNLNGVYGIDVYGNYAFIATWAGGLGNGLTIVDISDPDNPVYKTDLTDADLKATVDVDVDSTGTYAYLTSAGSHKLIIVDVSDPLNPSKVSATSGISAGPDSVSVNGDYAYVVYTPPPGPNNDAFEIFDVTNKSAPSAQGNDQSSFGGPEHIVVDSTGSYAYIADSTNNTLYVMDVTNKAAPSMIKAVTDASLNGSRGVNMDPNNDNFVYVASQTSDSLTVIDVSDPANAYVRGNVTNNTTLNGAIDVAVNGNFAYVASPTADSMTIIEVSSGGGGGSGSCTNPAASEGEVRYNSSQSVMQFCNGDYWAAMGRVPGTGGSGCTNPAKDPGAMLYNTDFNVMQYCDGTNWVAIGK